MKTVPCKDSFEERAAIMEYDGGLTRSRAEKLAAAQQGYFSVEQMKKDFVTDDEGLCSCPLCSLHN